MENKKYPDLFEVIKVAFKGRERPVHVVEKSGINFHYLMDSDLQLVGLDGYKKDGSQHSYAIKLRDGFIYTDMIGMIASKFGNFEQYVDKMSEYKEAYPGRSELISQILSARKDPSPEADTFLKNIQIIGLVMTNYENHSQLAEQIFFKILSDIEKKNPNDKELIYKIFSRCGRCFHEIDTKKAALEKVAYSPFATFEDIYRYVKSFNGYKDTDVETLKKLVNDAYHLAKKEIRQALDSDIFGKDLNKKIDDIVSKIDTLYVWLKEADKNNMYKYDSICKSIQDEFNIKSLLSIKGKGGEYMQKFETSMIEQNLVLCAENKTLQETIKKMQAEMDQAKLGLADRDDKIGNIQSANAKVKNKTFLRNKEMKNLFAAVENSKVKK